MAVEHTGGLLSDAAFWVAIAFVLFITFAIKKAWKPLVNFLDGRSAQIKADLDEAEKLRVAAQELLADYQRKHRDAMQTADEILATAKETAERLHTEAMEDLEHKMQRREELLLARIKQAEAQAVQDVQAQAADLAITAARQLVADNQNNASNLIDTAIADLGGDLKG